MQASFPSKYEQTRQRETANSNPGRTKVTRCDAILRFYGNMVLGPSVCFLEIINHYRENLEQDLRSGEPVGLSTCACQIH